MEAAITCRSPSSVAAADAGVRPGQPVPLSRSRAPGSGEAGVARGWWGAIGNDGLRRAQGCCTFGGGVEERGGRGPGGGGRGGRAQVLAQTEGESDGADRNGQGESRQS